MKCQETVRTVLTIMSMIFSDDMASHTTDLSRVLGRLMAAGFTLHGSKCFWKEQCVTPGIPIYCKPNSRENQGNSGMALS